MSSIDFVTFLEKQYPERYKKLKGSFERYLKGWSQFKVGMRVRTLRSGFGGRENLVRKIIKFGTDSCGEYFVLANEKDNGLHYGVYRQDEQCWWDAVEPIEGKREH